jgi:hypothetical protein
LICYERDDKPSGGNTSDMAYLVWQGQQEVIEEDGDDRNYIILVSILHQHSTSKKQWELTLTLDAVLRV